MKNRIMLIIAALSLIVAAAAMNILPDQIPMHFGVNGDADRIGSKYEIFLLAGVVIIVTIFGIVLRRRFEKEQLGASDEKDTAHAAANAKFCGIICTAICAVSLGVECIMIGVGYTGLQTLQGSSGELYCSALCILIGLLFTVCGNIMPKIKMNGVIGLRTTWSMKNEEVWARSQRMGGTLMFFGGVAMILSGLLLRGFPAIIAVSLIFIVIIAVALKGSHQIYKDWEKENE